MEATCQTCGFVAWVPNDEVTSGRSARFACSRCGTRHYVAFHVRVDPGWKAPVRTVGTLPPWARPIGAGPPPLPTRREHKVDLNDVLREADRREATRRAPLRPAEPRVAPFAPPRVAPSPIVSDAPPPAALPCMAASTTSTSVPVAPAPIWRPTRPKARAPWRAPLGAVVAGLVVGVVLAEPRARQLAANARAFVHDSVRVAETALHRARGNAVAQPPARPAVTHATVGEEAAERTATRDSDARIGEAAEKPAAPTRARASSAEAREGGDGAHAEPPPPTQIAAAPAPPLPKPVDMPPDPERADGASRGATARDDASDAVASTAPNTDRIQDAEIPFDRASAILGFRIAAGEAAACKESTDEGSWTGRVAVTFSPSGKATSAAVEGAPLAGTPAASCIAERFRNVRVPAFSGAPVVVSQSFTVP